MTVMVDELRVWPTKIACFKAGSCHLTTDPKRYKGLDREIFEVTLPAGSSAKWRER